MTDNIKFEAYDSTANMTKDQDYFLSKLQENHEIDSVITLREPNPPETVIYYSADKEVLTFSIKGNKILEFGKNGDFIVNGKLNTNDKELYEAVKFFFETTNRVLMENYGV